jgi:hypothetical protein
LSPSLKQVLKEFKGDLRRHLGEDVSQLKTRINWGNLDFLVDDLLMKPDSFDGVVLTARSKLRRRRSGKNQGARIVLVDSYMHSAEIGVIVIWLLNTNGNTNFINKGNNWQKFAATTSQGNDLCFHSRNSCLSLKFRRPVDRTSCNCNDISCATLNAYGVIVVLIAIETGKISVRVGINPNGCGRLDYHSLVLGSKKVAADPFDSNFM